MTNRPHTNLTIIEAVETLSSIADLELDKGVGVARNHEISVDSEKITYKTIHWLNQEDALATVSLVKETFRVILHYLKQFYRKEYTYVTDPKTIEGIKTIMVLVGDAAKKLDKYSSLLHLPHQRSVTELKEYKQLQDFYLSKIARKIDEGVLGKWILGLSLSKMERISAPLPVKVVPPASLDKMQESKHVFVDLETVKKDSEYELFFIRKEDGSRFFNPRLLRNIKLVCDFGDYFGEHREKDPLTNLKLWNDKIFYASARDLLKILGSELEHFFHDLRRNKDNEVVNLLNKALVALMLSAQTQNQLKNNPIKTSQEYFEDFQASLCEVLHSRQYQKWIAYPPKESNVLAYDLLNIIHTLCKALYANLKGMEEIISIIHVLIHEANQNVSKEHIKEATSSGKVWNKIASDYTAMSKLMKRHPNGPLLKVLSILDENSFHVFDSLKQYNIPNKLFEISFDGKKIEGLRFASPIYQEFINKAIINEEFKGFLRNYHSSQNKRHLLINLQDRTTWLEHARCKAIEELQNQSEFEGTLYVVTLAFDTDFYHQLASYQQMNHADVFKEQLKEHFKGEGSGFYFPDSIDKEKLFNFIDESVDLIHKIFFSNKNVLARERRLDFIEIFYAFLELKLIDLMQADSFSLTCKDGIDVGMTQNALLYCLLKFLNNSEWTEEDYDYINFMLYAPSILIRERLLLPDRFNRMLSALKTLENVQKEFGNGDIKNALSYLFNKSILNSEISK